VYSSPPPLLFVPNPISGFRMISFSLSQLLGPICS
jgi:hypothetical protein